jgi:hypothetical protein
MFSDYAALIVLLPVIAFVLTLFLGKKLPHGGAYLPIAAIAGSFIISLGIFLEIYPEGMVQQSIPWFRWDEYGYPDRPPGNSHAFDGIICQLAYSYLCSGIHVT